jgi:hypothetical protein
MMNRVKTWAPVVLAVVLVSAVSFGTAIKTWVSGERITPADLNSNFSHIHDNGVIVGEGARLTNNEVSATAAISHSKLATPALVPKAWAVWETACNAGTAGEVSCGAATASSRVTSAVGGIGIEGFYRITLNATLTNANFMVMVTPYNAGGAMATSCRVLSTNSTAPHVEIQCVCIDVGGSCAAVGDGHDTGFGIVVYDDDNI